jgi:hypothetical protein
MVLMPITEAIAYIDAYLSRLRQAREILSDGRTESPQKWIPPRNGKLSNKQAGSNAFNRRRTPKNKSRTNDPGAHLNRVMKRIDTGAQPHVPVPELEGIHTPSFEQRALAQPESTIRQSVIVTRVPTRRQSSSIRSVRPRGAKPDLGITPEVIKPAIALAGLRTNVVVVSAGQIEREREQAAHSEVRRPRTPTSGLSGRRAFEALFPD